MKKHLCLTVSLIFLVFVTPHRFSFSAGLFEAFTPAKKVESFPALSVFDKDGNPHNFQPGRITLINFWASWCSPCVVELPALDALAATLDKEEIDVHIVSIDSQESNALRTHKRLNILNMPFYIDRNSRLAHALKIRALPTTFLIDREGRLRATLNGPAEWGIEETKIAIDGLLLNPVP